jgi:hypothetical protein
MREASNDPREWDRVGAWTVLPEDAALARTPAFGRRFFAEMFEQYAALAATAVFLQWSEQPEDVYAFFDVPESGFGVQIDPHLEYIIIWGASGTAEFGDWDGDQVPPAIAHVRRIVS